MKSGIYIIINRITKKCYIGSSLDIKGRLRDHKKSLNDKNHHSILLQRSWNKHGEDNFKFEVVEYCPLNLLLEREQYWMDFYDVCNTDKGYNIAPKAGNNQGIKRSVEWVEKMRKAKKGARLKIDPIKKREALQKSWETRRENGKGKGGYKHSKKRSKEVGLKNWESRRLNGTDKMSLEGRQKLADYNRKYRTGVNHPRYGTVYPKGIKRNPEVGRLISLVKKYNNRQKNTVEFFKNNNMSELLNIVNY